MNLWFVMICCHSKNRVPHLKVWNWGSEKTFGAHVTWVFLFQGTTTSAIQTNPTKCRSFLDIQASIPYIHLTKKETTTASLRVWQFSKGLYDLGKSKISFHLISLPNPKDSKDQAWTLFLLAVQGYNTIARFHHVGLLPGTNCFRTGTLKVWFQKLRKQIFNISETMKRRKTTKTAEHFSHGTNKYGNQWKTQLDLINPFPSLAFTKALAITESVPWKDAVNIGTTSETKIMKWPAETEREGVTNHSLSVSCLAWSDITFYHHISLPCSAWSHNGRSFVVWPTSCNLQNRHFASCHKWTIMSRAGGYRQQGQK